MKISNFTLDKVKGTNKFNIDKEYFASVDVETGFLFWKKKERRAIRKEFANHWHFVDTGEWTPGFEVESLARAWKAKTGQDC